MHTLSLLAALSLCAGERFPLGPLGASAEVSPGSAAAAVVSVAADGPAAAADLRVGDLIVAAQGSAFEAHTNQVDDGGRGPQRALGEAVDAVLSGAWASAEDAGGGTLALAVEREGARVELELVLPRRPPLSGPDAAAGRAALRSAAAEQLLQSQRPNGSWDSPVGLSGDRVLSAWALVALLGHGAPEQRDAVDRAAQWLRGPEGRAWIPDDFLSKGPDNLGNWALTSTAVALSEHHLATCEQADRPVIARCLAALDARMDAEGRFGHDVSVGYGGKGFNVINTLYHLAVAMGAAAGLELDESAWELSMAQLRASISANGGVRYWTMAGTGTGDATLRTGSLALGLLLSGREPELATRLVAYLDAHSARAREAHAVGSLGMLVNAPALWIAGAESYERFLEEWRWYLSLMWGADGRIHYIGGKRNNGGDSYLGKDRMAAVIALQLLVCEDSRLRMHRRAGAVAPSAPQDG